MNNKAEQPGQCEDAWNLEKWRSSQSTSLTSNCDYYMTGTAVVELSRLFTTFVNRGDPLPENLPLLRYPRNSPLFLP